MPHSAIIAINIAVSVGLTAWVLSRVSLPELYLIALTANGSLLVLALSLHGLGLLFSAKRWAILLNIQQCEISLKAAVLLCWIGCFFNAVLPTNVGGDVVRTYLAFKQNGKAIDTAVSVIFERAVGIAALLGVCGMGLIWFYVFGAGTSVAESGAAFLYAGCVSIGAKTLLESALARVRLGHNFQRIVTVLQTYKSHKRKLLHILIFSFLLQTNVIIYYYTIAAALDIRLPFAYFCLVIPPILFLTMLPLSFGGIGVRETAFLFFFTPLGIEPAAIVTLSLCSYILALLANLAGGVIYWSYRPSPG